MKSEDLLKRRKKLKEEIIRVSSRMRQTAKELEEKSLEDFIQSDEIAPENESQAILKDFQDRLLYLQRMGKNLSYEIEKARREERLKKLKKKTREIEEVKQRRQDLYRRSVKLQKKIKEIQDESRSWAEKLQLLNGEKKTLSTSIIAVSMRLNKLESWLGKNFVRDEQKLVSQVKAIREQNREVWKGSEADDELVRQVEFSYDTDSGKILKLNFSGMSLERVKDSEHRDLFLTEALIAEKEVKK